jgi:membrane-bound lytic murein transglycosylase D
MIKRISVILIGFLLISNAFVQAQTPTVPSTLKFGDMTLELDNKVRGEIQVDVDRLYRSPTYFQSLLDRVNLYFPIIETVFREENVPDEFKYLVIQESALISDAVSVSNAVGFWQFKMASAQEVGMRVDRQIDERAHIERASRGAAKYLKRNNQTFDNWLYSLLSYNVGLGGALSIVDKKYYGSRKMPINSKTHWYVKKFLAHQVAFAGRTGLARHPELALYNLKGSPGIALEKIAADYSLDPKLVRDYNKWLKSEMIPNDGSFDVILPVKHDNERAIAQLTGKTYLENTPIVVNREIRTVSQPARNTARYQTKNEMEAVLGQRNDTQKELAKLGGISRRKFRNYNDLFRKEEIRPGQIYYFEKKARKAEREFHVLQPGQSLWEVSQEHGIRMGRLMKLNRIEPDEKVRDWRKLHLRKRIKKNQQVEYIRSTTQLASTTSPNTTQRPSSQESSNSSNIIERYVPSEQGYSIPAGHNKINYTVKRGDNYFNIAARHGVSMDDVLIWNNANASQALKEGTTLIIYIDPNKKKLPPAGPGSYYEVQPGDTLSAISRKTGASVPNIKDWNGLKDDIIHPGQKLRIKL